MDIGNLNSNSQSETRADEYRGPETDSEIKYKSVLNETIPPEGFDKGFIHNKPANMKTQISLRTISCIDRKQ